MEQIQLHKFLSVTKTVQRADSRFDKLRIAGISIDSRTLNAGELFVAIEGERYDGHDFIPAAIEKGAVGVVLSENKADRYLRGDKPVLVTTHTGDFLMELAGWYRQQFSIPVVAITGSTGKTTVKELATAVLERRYRLVKTPKNMNNFIGVPLTLFQLDKNTDLAVVEIGTNHPGEIKRLTKIVKPTHGAITNIGNSHIGFFGSKKAIFQEKKYLFDGMEPESTIFINNDDEFLKGYQRDGVKIIRFGRDSHCQYRVVEMGSNHLGCVTFRVNDSPPITLQIPGRHQLYNGLLAAAIGYELGLSGQEIKAGLEGFRSTNKRMEVFSRGGVLFINDAYNASPESTRAAIDYLCQLEIAPHSRRILVFGDMLELGDRSEPLHREIGEYVLDKPIDIIYLYGQYTPVIEEVIRRNPPMNRTVRWFPTHQEIAATLSENLRSGDVVLVKGSRGVAMENVFVHLGMGE
ncbi:MAG: UDP-N-acetylmuramoyl-tripeptide--D-alanyl-D-alanine ligase [Calditrichia bacterium]